MAKLFFIFLISFTFCGTTKAQSDIQAMLKQIALLAVHVKELENAIEIARDGLTAINEIKHGEFNLHNIFFSSLQSVNPAVAKYSRIAVIIAEQVSILLDFRSLLQRLKMNREITPSELSYVESVYSNMAEECSKTMNDLIVVITNGSLEMTDDERIKRIDVIAVDMNDKYTFSRQFTSGADKLIKEEQMKIGISGY
ncbi:MAG TPA: hypothetical protein VK772_13440 [Puia sp.]|jgi:hypothetical protein|nr:hypothetical protein [Puia sp.]